MFEQRVRQEAIPAVNFARFVGGCGQDEWVHAERFTAQLLSGPKPATPEQVVARLLAVQGQDPRGFRLTIRTRSDGVTAADVDTAMTERRSLVLAWLGRGTLHLVRGEDYWWLKPLTLPQLATGNATRLGQEGVSPKQADRGVEVVLGAVSSHGPRTRSELREALDSAGVPTAGQGFIHVLFAASLRGDLVRGPMRGTEHCFVSAAQWLGPAPEELDRSAALAKLARRYLAGHGPASAKDLAKWAGIGLREARTAFAAVVDEIFERADGLLDVADRAAAAPLPPPRLLGPFDPLLHGWESRDFVVGEHCGIVTSNGLFRPTALVDGRAVATWGLDAGLLTIRLLEPISKSARSALVKDAADVLRYLGLALTAPEIMDA
jgi:hypothetical protein